MRMTTTRVAERRPHRSRLDHPDLLTGSFHRGELAAGLAAVAVVAQCALAPAMLLIAALLVLVGRISRWQLAWLLLPALGSACWLGVAGLPATAHALTAGAARLTAADLAVALHPGRLLHPAAAFAGSGRWVPRELPLLLLAGTAEAAIALWPHRTQRPGLIAALRRRAAAAALAAGHTVTAGGFAIGVSGSGRRSAVSWAQAERGVLLTGGDPVALDQIGLAIACAAVRRRKAVLVLDLSAAGGTSVCAQVAGLAGRAGVPVTRIGSVAHDGLEASKAGSAGRVRISGAVGLNGACGRAIRARSVVLAQPEAAQQALSELAGTLTSLRDLGLRADCLAWVAGCEAVDASRLSGLLALGHATGTAVVLSATSPELAAELAADAGVVIASGPVTSNLAERLGDLAAGNSSAAAKRPFSALLREQPRASATMIADGAIAGHGCFLTVPIEVTEVR
jgi:hypothetical protein